MVFKVVNKCPPEIDMSSLQKILRGCWRSYLFDQWYKNNKPKTMALIFLPTLPKSDYSMTQFSSENF